jgi:hypothetical protein
MTIIPSDATQQGEIGAEPPSLAARERALAVAFKHAEAVVGGQGGPGLQQRTQYILEHAREHKLAPRLYRIAWSVNRILKANDCSESNQFTNSHSSGGTENNG